MHALLTEKMKNRSSFYIDSQEETVMSILVIGGLVVAGLAYLAKHDQQHNAEYFDHAKKIEREIQAARDKAMLQHF
jgi:hypothetical protein